MERSGVEATEVWAMNRQRPEREIREMDNMGGRRSATPRGMMRRVGARLPEWVTI